MSDKLLPCPWCGAQPNIRRGHFIEQPSVRYRAACTTEKCCSQTGWQESPGNAREAWNKRAPDPERDAMARVCKAAKDMCYLYAYDISEAMRRALADLERARKGEG